MKHVIRIAILALTVVLSTTLRTNADASENVDSLYIGDQTDPFAIGNTVKRFNAETGAYLGAFVTSNSGSLHGPRGLIFSQRRSSDFDAGASASDRENLGWIHSFPIGRSHVSVDWLLQACQFSSRRAFGYRGYCLRAGWQALRAIGAHMEWGVEAR